MRNAKESCDSFRAVVRAFCIGLNTPRSLKAWLLYENKEFAQLASWKVHPLEYNDADAYMVDSSVVTFFKKNADLPKTVDTKAEAIASFVRSEESCRQTNARLDKFANDGQCDRHVVQVLHLAQRKIADLLSLADVDGALYSWGPGASSDLKKSVAYPDEKLTKLPLTVTGSAWKHAARMINLDLHWKEAIIRANPGYTGPIFQVDPGGRYDTVKKTVLTDRSILVEPRLNTPLQKRAGTQLKGLLKRVGVDLEDQSRNQYLAEYAIALGLATLDLEAASDTVARKLVEFLLPPVWFDYMDDVRSKWVNLEGRWLRLEKFSSMGNGFTFELESLIFWALTSACTDICGFTRDTIGIYGDDIICRKEVVPLLVEVLSWCGFTLNRDKSFTEGVFYESCGAHFFEGHDVTPLYQKCIPRCGFEISLLGNRLMRFACRLGGNISLDKRVAPAWEQARRWGQPRADQFGPISEAGNGYWEAPASLYLARARSSSAGPAVTVASYSVVERVIPANDNAMLALWLLHHQGGRCTSGPPLTDPLVSITGTSRKAKVVCNDVGPGMIVSRLKPRYTIKHRKVLIPSAATLIDW